jgi:hypothetical protein
VVRKETARLLKVNKWLHFSHKLACLDEFDVFPSLILIEWSLRKIQTFLWLRARSSQSIVLFLFLFLYTCFNFWLWWFGLHAFFNIYNCLKLGNVLQIFLSFCCLWQFKDIICQFCTDLKLFELVCGDLPGPS